MPRNATGTYLAAAEAAAVLISDPLITARWGEPSALAEFTVGGLAGHLARQITMVPGLLQHEPAQGWEQEQAQGWEQEQGHEVIGVLDHYARAAWVDAALDDEANVSIRRSSEAEAAAGPGALVLRTTRVIAELTTRLPAEDPRRLIYLPWTGWALTLEDFLATRLLEIVIHADDLAVSVSAEHSMNDDATDTVLVLLTRLAARRHGTAAVLRAFSRKERAPAVIAAF